MYPYIVLLLIGVSGGFIGLVDGSGFLKSMFVAIMIGHYLIATKIDGKKSIYIASSICLLLFVLCVITATVMLFMPSFQWRYAIFIFCTAVTLFFSFFVLHIWEEETCAQCGSTSCSGLHRL